MSTSGGESSSGVTNAYAHATDGTHTADASGADTLDFTSPTGTILFTVVPGSPAGIEADLITPVTIANGGTNATAKQAAFDNLSPLSSEGDFVYFHSSHNARLALGTAGQTLLSNGTDPAWSNPPAWGVCGDGSDGVQNFDGTSTVLGLAPSSHVYTLTRDIYLADGSQLSGSAQIATADFRVFCSGTLTVGASALITGNGNNAANNTAGGATGNGFFAVPGKAGGNGNAGTTGTGGGAATPGSGGSGGAGGSNNGGGGTGGGVAGGTATAPSAVQGVPRNIVQALNGTAGPITQSTAGAGGSGGNAAASSTGGGGGGGAGIVGVYAVRLVNNGIISANGGTGGNATGSGTGAGGGGGGGGGVIIIICGPDSTLGTLQVNGGTGGNFQGNGNKGANGASGNTFTLTL